MAPESVRPAASRGFVLHVASPGGTYPETWVMLLRSVPVLGFVLARIWTSNVISQKDCWFAGMTIGLLGVNAKKFGAAPGGCPVVHVTPHVVRIVESPR